MPASPATSPNLALPRFASDSVATIWTLLNGIVDGLDARFGAWTSYSPTWTQSDGSTLVLNDGTITGRYKRLGQLVVGNILLVRGADSNVGTTHWIFGLPPVAPKDYRMLGGGFSMMRGGAFYGGGVFPVSSSAIGAIVGDLGRVGGTIPTSNTHAAGDWYSLQFVYEPA